MINLFLITSVINIPMDKPFSYTNVRSVYDKNTRFSQTKQTIESIKERVPNVKILLVECSNLSEEETSYLKKNVDYFINIYDINNTFSVNDRVFSRSKSMGEGELLINGIEYIFKNNIEFDNLFKISGRYTLGSFFNYDNFNNKFIVVKNNTQPYQNYTALYTFLYKLDKGSSLKWYNYLKNSHKEFEKCEAIEVIFANFIKKQNQENIIFIDKLGVNGNIAVDGYIIDH